MIMLLCLSFYAIHKLQGDIDIDKSLESMATYFDANTENGDGLQTLILMKQQSFNFIFHNSISSATSVNQPPSYLTSQAASSQGLSLSLSPRIQGMEAPLPVVDQVRIPVLRCKDMKAAQELLDEVIYLGKQAKNSSRHSDKLISAVGDGITKRGPQIELTTAEKQEIQMKKAKLVIMLHEVEQRYKQYEHKLQMVIRWLDEAAGEGSAKTYTALAFDTISKQFRCLKDAIFGQIRLANKNLGEEAKSEGWRLKYMDTQIRQHLGMVQHNAWRPQRGLPEDSVSILRAWLFDHFLHPYPKDDDKILLAKKTGLTRSQVSNWFINARVRLWKPMVEEMYAEEVKGQGQRTDDRIAGNSKHMEVPKETEIESKHIAMNFLASYPIEGQQQFQPSYSVNGVSLTLGLQHGENIMSKQTMHQGQGADIAQSK